MSSGNKMHVSLGLFSLGFLLLAGCASDPSTSIAQPMTKRPEAVKQVPSGNGTIYGTGNAHPLFEDRRARFVGDTLTINIIENTAASKSSSDGINRSSSAAVSAPTPTVLGFTPTPPSLPGNNGTFNTSMNTSSAIKVSNNDSNSNSNSFNGAITVTVIEVLPNGNLLVSGEKQVAVNQQTEYIRISGVVNPLNLTAANTVNSTQLSEAKVESKGKTRIDSSQLASMMSRFFMLLLPF